MKLNEKNRKSNCVLLCWFCVVVLSCILLVLFIWPARTMKELTNNFTTGYLEESVDNEYVRPNVILYRYFQGDCNKCILEDAFLVGRLKRRGVPVVVLVNDFKNRNDSISMVSVFNDIGINVVEDSVLRLCVGQKDRYFAYVDKNNRISNVFFPGLSGDHADDFYELYMSLVLGGSVKKYKFESFISSLIE